MKRKPLSGLRTALVFSGLGIFCVVCESVFAQGSRDPSDSKNASLSDAFERRLVSLAASSGRGDVEVTWKFVNRWDFPTAVERFEESCSCLQGKIGNAVIEPGQSGTISATFNPGHYRGKVRKSLHVRFVGHDKPVELEAEMFVPSSVTLSSQDLIWKKGEGGGAQSIDLKAGTAADFHITALLGLSPEEFTVQAETLTEGRHYRLTLTPGVKAPATATRCLQIRTDSPDPRDRVFALFIQTGAEPKQATGSHPQKSTTSTAITGP